MEHNAPRHDLDEVKRLIREGCFIITKSALSGAHSLGMFHSDIVSVALSLKRREFYKSMTAYQDHSLWMDVYRTRTNATDIYFKLTIEEDAVILSFKEL